MKIYAWILIVTSFSQEVLGMEKAQEKTANQLASQIVNNPGNIDLAQFERTIKKDDFDVNHKYLEEANGTLAHLLCAQIDAKKINAAEALKMLFEQHKNLNPSVTNKSRHCLLEVAILANTTDALKIIISCMQQLNLDINKDSPLHFAVKEDKVEHMKILLQQKDMNPNLGRPHFPLQNPLNETLQKSDNEDETKANFQKLHLMRLLVEAGANINCAHEHENCANQSLLLGAIGTYDNEESRCSVDRIIALIVNGAKAEHTVNLAHSHLKIESMPCDLFVHGHAVLKSHMIKALSQDQGDENKKVIADAFETAFYGDEGMKEDIQIWKNKGLIDVRDSIFQMTPAMWAVVFGHFAMLKLLVDNGANLLIKDRWGYNALHLAVFHDRSSTAQYIMQKESKTAIARNTNQENPIDLAIKLTKSQSRSKDLLKVLHTETQKLLQAQ